PRDHADAEGGVERRRLVRDGQQARRRPAPLLGLGDALLIEANLCARVEEQLADSPELHRAHHGVGVILGAVLTPALVRALELLRTCHTNILPLRLPAQPAWLDSPVSHVTEDCQTQTRGSEIRRRGLPRATAGR